MLTENHKKFQKECVLNSYIQGNGEVKYARWTHSPTGNSIDILPPFTRMQQEFCLLALYKCINENPTTINTLFDWNKK